MTITANAPWAYRPDVDGLRAIAVIGVLLSHLGLKAVGGGYVGVDMFFVISGYIISGDLLRRAEAGSFSARAFYLRRTRRLLPNLLAMVVVVFAIASLLFLPEDLFRLPSRMTASVFGFSNWLFALESGYFLPASSWNPLLHTWTLAVEFQFYLLAPLLAIAAHRLGRRSLRVIVTVAGVGSLAYAILTSRTGESWHFYDTGARAWEFLLGIALNLWRLPTVRKRMADLLCLLAGVALLWAFTTFPRDAFFPDLRALVPTLATAMLIAFAPSSGWARRGLESKVAVSLGLQSYAIYVWHWPIIVFATYLWPDLAGTNDLAAVLIPLIFAVSYLSYKVVETPCRSSLIVPNRKFALAIVGGVGAIGAGSAAILRTDGFIERFDESESAILLAGSDISPHRAGCHRNDLGIPIQRSCRFGDSTVAPSVAMWSDSHGVEMLETLAPKLAAANRSAILLSFSSCPPRAPRRLRSDCDRFNRAALDYLLSSPGITTVILAGAMDHPVYKKDDAWAREFMAAARALQRAKKRLVLVYPVPWHRAHSLRVLVNEHRFGIDHRTALTTLQTYRNRNQRVWAVYDAIGGADMVRVRPHLELCGSGRCQIDWRGHPLYFDDNHLTLRGARLLGDQFATAMEETVPPPRAVLVSPSRQRSHTAVNAPG